MILAMEVIAHFLLIAHACYQQAPKKKAATKKKTATKKKAAPKKKTATKKKATKKTAKK